MMDQTKRDYFDKRISAMETERGTFISHYKDLAQHIQPRRGRFFITDRNKGTKRHNSIINSKATKAHQIARSGMLAGTMSPTRPWFALETPDPELMEFQPVKIWLSKVEMIMRAIFNQSNFYNMSSTMIGEMLLFGTGCMSHVNDFKDVARFYAHTAGSYMIAQDERQQITTFVRQVEWSVSQIVKEFGLDNTSTAIKSHYDKGNYDAWVPITQFIEPNANFNPRKQQSENKAFLSTYFEPGREGPAKDKFLRQKGFDEFPVYCPRWDVTDGDIYGTDCPAMTALGDIKGLQIEEKRKAQAIDKMVNPPMKGPASLKNVPIVGLPGGSTLYDGDDTKQKLEPIYKVDISLSELRADITAVERRIDGAFFVDMFLAISTMEGIQPRNELDLSQRNEERLLQLGPVLENQQTEFLNLVIDRTFNQCLRAGILPEPPPELAGVHLQVRYISTLALAQRAVATQSIDRLFSFAAGVRQAGWEQSSMKFDADQAIDEYAKAVGTPPKIVVPDDVVAAQREQQAQQQAQAAALEAGQSMANTAKMLSDAKTGGEENALTDVAKGI